MYNIGLIGVNIDKLEYLYKPAEETVKTKLEEYRFFCLPILSTGSKPEVFH